MSRIMNIKIRYPAFFDIWEDRSIVGKEFDLSEIVKADTYDAKVNRNLTITGMPEVEKKLEGLFEEKKEEDPT